VASTETRESGDDAAGSSPPVILGMGNILYGDEGVGVYAARALAESFRCTPEVEVSDGAMLGFAVMEFFSSPRSVIVLDAIAVDAPVGTVFKVPAEQLRALGSEMRPTAHEVDPVQLLRLAPLLGGSEDVILMGIVPENTSELSVGLTDTLALAFERYVLSVVGELLARGVRVEQCAPISLDSVVASLVGGFQ